MRVAGNQHELCVASTRPGDCFPFVIVEVNLGHFIGAVRTNGYNSKFSPAAASLPRQRIMVETAHFLPGLLVLLLIGKNIGKNRV